MNMLAAVRCGEMQPIMLARTLATLDHMLEGAADRRTSSAADFPGQKEPSPYRYQRSREVVEILRQAWTRDEINHEGEIYQFEGLTTDPVQARISRMAARCCTFGGYSPDAVDLCAEHCDVYLMWPETQGGNLAGRMQTVAARAQRVRAHAGLRAARPHDRAGDRGRGARIRPRPWSPGWTTKRGQGDPRTGAGCGLAGGLEAGAATASWRIWRGSSNRMLWDRRGGVRARGAGRRWWGPRIKILTQASKDYQEMGIRCVSSSRATRIWRNVTGWANWSCPNWQPVRCRRNMAGCRRARPRRPLGVGARG